MSEYRRALEHYAKQKAILRQLGDDVRRHRHTIISFDEARLTYARVCIRLCGSRPRAYRMI